MTLEEKIGQMIQPEIREVTIEEFKQYKFGSILTVAGHGRTTINGRRRKNGQTKPMSFGTPLKRCLPIALLLFRLFGRRMPFMGTTTPLVRLSSPQYRLRLRS